MPLPRWVWSWRHLLVWIVFKLDTAEVPQDSSRGTRTERKTAVEEWPQPAQSDQASLALTALFPMYLPATSNATPSAEAQTGCSHFQQPKLKKHIYFIFMYLTSHTVYPRKSMGFPKELCYLIHFKWWWMCSCSVNYKWCHFQEVTGQSTFAAMLALST